MELKLNISFKEIMSLVKQLPENQLIILKKEIEFKENTSKINSDFKEFLLKGPVFDSSQIKKIKKTREEINKWREN